MSKIGALSGVNFVFYAQMISTVLLYMSYSAKNKPFSYNYFGKCQGLPAGPAGPDSAPMLAGHHEAPEAGKLSNAEPQVVQRQKLPKSGQRRVRCRTVQNDCGSSWVE